MPGPLEIEISRGTQTEKIRIKGPEVSTLDQGDNDAEIVDAVTKLIYQVIDRTAKEKLAAYWRQWMEENVTILS